MVEIVGLNAIKQEFVRDNVRKNIQKMNKLSYATKSTAISNLMFLFSQQVHRRSQVDVITKRNVILCNIWLFYPSRFA